MDGVSLAMAKLAGIRKAILSVMNENVSRSRSKGDILTRGSFSPDLVKHFFVGAANLVSDLKSHLPELFSDFQEIKTEPETLMAVPSGETTAPMHYSRAQAERLVRDIEQIFEIRANSELSQPIQGQLKCVFISHGGSPDWRKVQAYIEKDLKISTLELAQEVNGGLTIIEKLERNAARCDCAVIIMTGEDLFQNDLARVRENVMHEIGYFQGKYGRNFVILLHEEGVNIPTNLSGVAYAPFPKGYIEAGYQVLNRELNSIYGL